MKLQLHSLVERLKSKSRKYISSINKNKIAENLKSAF